MSVAVAGGSPNARRRRSRGYRPDRVPASPDENTGDRVKGDSDVDIQDYAETTMNELLGWYGYDRLDHPRPLASRRSSTTSSGTRDFSEDELSHSPVQFDATSADSPSATLNGATTTCGWCSKSGLKLFVQKTASGKTRSFCSEQCFNQCRRAAFKKSRVCNWCHHVRHTVNYVDFKDGDDQLQFCSDKCLNQYKMQIFCKETQAYLQMNPHLQEESNKQTGTANSKLITPDLWLRDCQGPTNGGAINSDEEQAQPAPSASKTGNNLVVEDLTVSSPRQENFSLHDKTTTIQEKDKSNEKLKASLSAHFLDRKTPFEIGSASQLNDDKDTMSIDRKRRYYNNHRDHFRKRQKSSSAKVLSSPDAPPAHLSSIYSPLFLPNRLIHHLPYAHPINLHQNQSLAPPAAHSKVPSVRSSLSGGSLVAQNPPPLLNSEFLHHYPLSSAFSSFTSQPHLDAFMRMQASGAKTEQFLPSNVPRETMPPYKRTLDTNSYMQANTVMLPYPVFIPLPVPIPIPIPLTGLKSKDNKVAVGDDRKSSSSLSLSSENGDILNVDSDTSTEDKAIQSDKKDILCIETEKKVNSTVGVTTTYAVKNDNFSNRLILTRNKT